MRHIIVPTSEEHWLEMRTKVITSTEVSALFGISPYTTMFELWHRKKEQNYVKLEANERMELGTALQDSIAKHIAKKQGWSIRRMEEFIFDDETRIGASFDFMITDNAEGGSCLLEIKNVDGLVYKNDWIPSDEGQPQSPLHIEIQVQMEMLVSGVNACYIGACIGGNHIEIIKRTADSKVQQAILVKCAEFWKSIADGTDPPPVFPDDAKFITSLYNLAQPGTSVDISTDQDLSVLAMDYRELGEAIKEAEAKRETIKAKMLMAIGQAEKAIGSGYKISAGMTEGKHIEFDRAAFRNFRITYAK